MSIPEVSRRVLFAAQRRDGRVRIAGQHEAWAAVGFDPRDCLLPGQRGDEARVFGRDLAVFCAAAVASLEASDA